MANKGTIIFDFDGTIADSFDFVVSFLARQIGTQTLTPQQRKHLEGLPMRAIAKELHIPKWRFPLLFFEGRRVMGGSMDKIEPFPGIETALRELHDQGYEFFALSSNRSKNIQLFLQRYELAKYFSKTQGNASILGKTHSLRVMLRRNGLQPHECVYVGDEVGDLQAARRVNVRAVAVSWGYNDGPMLSAGKPFGLANTPAELVQVLTRADTMKE
ncbi:MAG TPA: HAD-IA family hydrolase [Candidatus Saccharimonadales bacterium]|jgi:phosphoglycolate phosphatase-like HAD superfamily hydrolase